VGGSGSELYTISGEATSSGTVLPWKFILKMFNHEGEGWQEGSTDPMAWDFWKREWLVYQAPWIQGLREGLVAPHCFGSGELGETAAWVAMEDLTVVDQRPWSLSRFAAAARHLGEFNGRFLVDRDPPANWWLSRGWHRGWTERAESMITQLPSLADHPVVTELFAPSNIGLLLQVWEHRREVYEALDELPQSICHQNLFPRNAFIRVAGGAEQTVAIDWAFCGLGSRGCRFGAPAWRLPDLLRGRLRPGRRTGTALPGRLPRRPATHRLQGNCDDVFLGYLATIALRFMVGAVAPLLTGTLDDSLDGMIEQIFGHSKPELIARWRKIHEFFDEPRLASLLTTFGYASHRPHTGSHAHS
jgi:hypothetical protein